MSIRRAASIAVIYVAANIASITTVELPMLGMFVWWGVAGPLAMAIASWIWLRARIRTTRHWIAVSGVITVFFVGLGYWSLYRIGDIWASV